MLKTQDIKENDKLLWIFTDKIGKITAIAKGVKRSTSKFLSISLPLCYGEYMVFKGKNMYTLNEGILIESFQELLNDLTTITYSSYICELIDISVPDEESNSELFKTLVIALYLMKTHAVDNEILVRAFELKLLRLTGYGINFDNCSICRKKIATSNYLSFQYYGGVCAECVKEKGMNINKASFSALKFLDSIPLEKVYRVNLSEPVKVELAKITSILISSSYSRIPKSLQMLEFIKESE